MFISTWRFRSIFRYTTPIGLVAPQTFRYSSSSRVSTRQTRKVA